MLSFTNKLNSVFYKLIAISFLFLIIFLNIGVLLYQRLTLLIRAFSDKLQALCGCSISFSFFQHPWISSLLFISASIIVTFIIFTIIKSFKLQIKNKLFIKYCLRDRQEKISSRLLEVAAGLGLDNRIIEVKSREPLVFCFGLTKSRICISSSLIKELEDCELRAILLHEQHHLKNWETIKIFIVKVVSSVLFFIPGVKILERKYYLLSEVAADQWAIKNCSDKTPLVKAMYRMLELRENLGLNSADSLAIPSFALVIEERIKKITDDNYVISFKFIKSKLLSRILVLSLFMFIFSYSIYSTKASILDNHDACTMGQGGLSGCEMSSLEDTCLMSSGVVYSGFNCFK